MTGAREHVHFSGLTSDVEKFTHAPLRASCHYLTVIIQVSQGFQVPAAVICSRGLVSVSVAVEILSCWFG